LSNEDNEFAKQVATALINAKNPLIISGTSPGRKAILRSASNVLRALSLGRQNSGSLSLQC
jgi:NADH-quinone oxidoreductase subunit G